MIFRNVKRDKVMPGIFNLWTFNDGEPQASHDLLEVFDRLRNRVHMPQSSANAWQSWIQTSWQRRIGARFDADSRCIQSRLYAILDFVELHIAGPFVGAGQVADFFLQALELAAPRTGELHAGGFEAGAIAGRAERGFSLQDQSIECFKELIQLHRSALSKAY